GDTGSPEVQVALLTTRISELTGHLKINKKDDRENNIKEKEDEDLLQKAQEKGLSALSADVKKASDEAFKYTSNPYATGADKLLEVQQRLKTFVD
ncbi:hypothetical protein PO81_10820, partial [Vibrio parahaemolyticus]